ncbi:MAG: helix-turn-helix domain-containing protein [Candidatus Hodarchaeales archaeon]|jgi:DNA-binding transcriptional ArsR family regulator
MPRSTDNVSSESILLHPLRRRIYSVVAQAHGSNFSKIADVMNISSSTLSWHLKRLEKSGLLKSGKFAGKRIYYPSSLRSKLAEQIIQILSNETARKIFLYIINLPDEDCYPLNISRNIDPPLHHETVRYHIDRMKKVGLIETTKDGQTVLVQPGPEAYRLKEHGMNVISESYLDFLFKNLRKDCLYPEIIEHEPDHLVLRIECPHGEEIILDLILSDWDFQGIINEIKK